MVKPISPEQVGAEQVKSIPSEIFVAFNALIAQNFTNGRSKVLQSDVVSEIKKLRDIKGLDPTVSPSKELNIEEAYRAEGWEVTYTKPDYTQSFPAYFEFIKRR